MKIKLIAFAIILTFAFIGYKASAFEGGAPTPKDGKTLFVDSKCINCHSITVASIESKKKNNPVDLSTVGDKANAELITKYLKKEVQINDKNHSFLFKGEDADLTILATWLAGLKTPAK